MAKMSLQELDGSPAVASALAQSNTDVCGPEETTSASGQPAGEAETIKLPCAFFMRTGTCAYGNRCKFSHPVDRPQVYMNSRGLPLRPAEPECTFYMRNGWCAFSDTCKFNHPELTNTPPATGTQQQQQQQGGQGGGQPRQQKQQQQQQHGGKSNGGSSGRSHHGPHHPGGHVSMGHMGPYGHMAAMPGQHVMMPMGYYHPVMPPHARMYHTVAVSSPMIHPVMHIRPPYVSMPMVASPVGALTSHMAGLGMNGTGGRSGRGKHHHHNSSSGSKGGNGSKAGAGGSSGASAKGTTRDNSPGAAVADAPVGEDQHQEQ